MKGYPNGKAKPSSSKVTVAQIVSNVVIVSFMRSLAGTLGFQWAFAINAFSFLVSAYMVSDLEAAPASREKASTSAWQEIVGGVNMVRGNQRLTYLFVLFALFTLVVGIQFPLMYVFIAEQLRGGPSEAGWLFSSIGIGALASGAWLASLSKENQPFDIRTLKGRRNIAVLAAMDGVVVIAMAMQSQLVPTMFLFAGFGFLGTLFHTALQSAIVGECPEDLRGRVFALHSAINGPLIVLSVGIGAPLAKEYGSVPVFNVSALLELALGVACWIWARQQMDGDVEAVEPTVSIAR